MKFKPGITDNGVHWKIGYALATAEYIYTSFGFELEVTALTNGEHNPGSLHPKGLAADLRTKNLPARVVTEVFDRLKAKLHPLGFDVVPEGGVGATPFTTGAHIHIESDPHGIIWPQEAP